jgi:polyphenol oxidase
MRDINILRFDNLSSVGNVVHGISTRAFGSMKNADNSLNIDNIDKFAHELGISEKSICMHQVHGSNVEVVNDGYVMDSKGTDGLITNKTNTPLCVLVADCLPLLFYDKQKEIIGIGHGGRRGLEKGIIKNVVEKMKSEFGSDPSDIIVGIGPGIEKNCYEVDGELMDIKKIAKDEFLRAGILEKNIEDMQICTKCNSDKFYSYRSGDGTDRFSAVISLK